LSIRMLYAALKRRSSTVAHESWILRLNFKPVRLIDL
jgi:hypothetical protein